MLTQLILLQHSAHTFPQRAPNRVRGSAALSAPGRLPALPTAWFSPEKTQ